MERGAVLEQVFGGGEFTEGPAMGPDGCVYFSDLTFDVDSLNEDGHIWRYDPTTQACSVFRSPSGLANGIEFDELGRMVLAQGSDFGGCGIVRKNLSDGRGVILAAGYNGRPFNSPNDLIIDSRGNIYFTDPRYGSLVNLPQPVRGVYRIDPEGGLTILVNSISNPNGIAISPDERFLYVGCYDEETPEMNIQLHRLLADGTARYVKTLVEFMPPVGPDGIAVDTAGYLYVAVRDEKNPGVGIYNSEGLPVGWIASPEVPSNVAFGRPPADSVLYVTAGRSLYKICTIRRGFFAARWSN